MTSQVNEFFVGHCEVAARMAQRLELDHSTESPATGFKKIVLDLRTEDMSR